MTNSINNSVLASITLADVVNAIEQVGGDMADNVTAEYSKWAQDRINAKTDVNAPVLSRDEVVIAAFSSLGINTEVEADKQANVNLALGALFNLCVGLGWVTGLSANKKVGVMRNNQSRQDIGVTALRKAIAESKEPKEVISKEAREAEKAEKEAKRAANKAAANEKARGRLEAARSRLLALPVAE